MEIQDKVRLFGSVPKAFKEAKKMNKDKKLLKADLPKGFQNKWGEALILKKKL